MDAFDRHILKLLQSNNRMTTEDIGQRVGLSATACQRRIKKLREDGVIRKDIAVVDGIRLGGYVTVIVEVVIEKGGAAAIEGFKKQMLGHGEVQQCYYVSGAVDFILVVTAADMSAYEKLTHKLFLNNTNIKKFHSTVVMENVKVGLDIPV